jgi:hypothetical protein
MMNTGCLWRRNQLAFGKSQPTAMAVCEPHAGSSERLTRKPICQTTPGNKGLVWQIGFFVTEIARIVARIVAKIGTAMTASSEKLEHSIHLCFAT